MNKTTNQKVTFEAKNTTNIIKLPEVWMNQLNLTNQGTIKNTIPNFVLILKNDEDLKNKFRFNEHSNRIEFKNKNGCHNINNLDMSIIKNTIEKKYGIYSKDKITDALDIVANEDSYHPIKEYLESLKWDGIKRIDTAFSDYFGAKEIPYNSMCMRLILLGAIERVFEPGCKFDPMVIIRGAQGLGKSTFFRYLCGKDKYFQGNFKDIDKSFDLTNGKWICEMAELSGLKKAEKREEIKAYLTLVSDTHRTPYTQFSEDYPRQFILVGTTNETVFLNDDTGERRFPIVECANKKEKFKKSVFDKDGKYEIQQLLAEAFVEYKNGVRLYDVPIEFQEEMEQIQSGYRSENTERGVIESYLSNKKEVCLLQIWCEAFKHKISDKFTQSDKNKIVKVLNDLPNWKLFEGSKDHRKNFKDINVGFDNYGNAVTVDYGKQKAWIWYETEEDIRKKQEEVLKKEQERITENINKINDTNIKNEQMWF